MKRAINNVQERRIKNAMKDQITFGAYFRQAIQVRYLTVTNRKPARYKAFIQNGKSITRSADDRTPLSVAMELACLLEWDGTWRGAALPNGDFAFVCEVANDTTPTFYVSKYDFDKPE